MLPEGWMYTMLQEICIEKGLQTGPFGSQLKANEYTEDVDSIPVIMPKDIDNGRINILTASRVSKKKATSLARHCLKEGDILFPRRGELGRIAIIDLASQGMLCGTGCLRARLKAGFSYEFFLHYFRFSSVENWLVEHAVGQTMLNLNTSIISNLPILLPPLPGAKKIAEILSTWDAAIETVEKLIANAEAQKKALMQQLLAGKKRLPGFSGKWKECSLGKLAKIYQPQTISQSDLTEEGYPVYGANGLIGHYEHYNHDTWQTLITCRGSTCGTVNKTTGKAWITGNAMVMNVDANGDIDKSFFYYLLSNINFVPLISGSGQPQITGRPLAALEVFFRLSKLNRLSWLRYLVHLMTLLRHWVLYF